MSKIDFENLRSTTHLPYELEASGQTVYSLSANFRLAINFRDLAMMRGPSVMNIMDTPEAIQTSLEQTAENK